MPIIDTAHYYLKGGLFCPSIIHTFCMSFAASVLLWHRHKTNSVAVTMITKPCRLKQQYLQVLWVNRVFIQHLLQPLPGLLLVAQLVVGLAEEQPVVREEAGSSYICIHREWKQVASG